MQGDWIKFHRGAKDWVFWKDKNLVHLWLNLLLSCAYQEAEEDGVTLKPGQILISLSTLAEEEKVSKQELRTMLKKLVSEGQISTETVAVKIEAATHQSTQRATHRKTLLTILNWGSYQYLKNNEQHINQHNEQHNEQKERNKESESSPTPLQRERNKKKEKQVRSREEEIIIDTTTGAYERVCPREEDFRDVEQDWLEELLTNRQWLESVQMRYHVDADAIRIYAKDFLLEQQIKGIRHQNQSDQRKHFADWLRIQTQTRYGNNRTSNTANSATARAERIERVYAPLMQEYLRRAEADIALR